MFLPTSDNISVDVPSPRPRVRPASLSAMLAASLHAHSHVAFICNSILVRASHLRLPAIALALPARPGARRQWCVVYVLSRRDVAQPGFRMHSLPTGHSHATRRRTGCYAMHHMTSRYDDVDRPHAVPALPARTAWGRREACVRRVVYDGHAPARVGRRRGARDMTAVTGQKRRSKEFRSSKSVCRPTEETCATETF